MRALTATRALRAQLGFTLVELCIAFTVLVVILGSIGLVIMSAQGIYEQGMSASALESQTRRTLQRLANELTSAGAGTVQLCDGCPEALPTAPLGGSNLFFQTCAGYAGGMLQWNPRSSIQLRPDPRDAVDGVDNNGNGSIDEQQIVLVINAGQADETEAVICGGVRNLLEGETANFGDDNGNGLTDERGLSIVSDGDGTLTIRLTLEARNPQGRLVQRTGETSVHMRN